MSGSVVTSCRYVFPPSCRDDDPSIQVPPQAHVDGTATIVENQPDGDSLRLRFQFPEPTLERPSLLPYLIPKGYVTVDGASLTLTTVDDEQRTFSVMLIQHTQQIIALGRKPIGAKVNVEVDMVGKYVEKSVLAALGGRSGDGLKAMIERVVEDALKKKS
jgi:riboflavin synthase